MELIDAEVLGKKAGEITRMRLRLRLRMKTIVNLNNFEWFFIDLLFGCIIQAV